MSSMLRSLLMVASITVAVAPKGNAETEPIDNDFRYISYDDLMASGAEEFTDEGVTSFGQILFDVARDQLFVGARDYLYRLSLKGLNLIEKTQWTAARDKVSLCQDKGQSEDDCHNYVKVLLSDSRRLFVCGTHAFSPQCSWRKLDNMSQVLDVVKGVGKCPYSPRANVTSLISTDGDYYVGSTTDFLGSDPAIYRAIINLSYGGHMLRTKQYDPKWLNEPQFVGSFEDDKFVYFVFRESAVEYMNCGKRIFSRIARICKNDMGGDVLLRDNWTTFVKARLNCSKPGDYPFYYDEVQDIKYLPDKKLLYAVFTTPRNSIPGSAICIFNMSAIDEAFRGPFKYQEHVGSTWESRNVPHQQHTQCHNLRSSQHTDFLRYQLMDKAVKANTYEPIHIVEMEFYTHISVTAVSAKYSNIHVIFVANENGLIKKLSILSDKSQACLIEMWKPVLDSQVSPIKTMKFQEITRSLYIGTEHSIVQIPASRCARHLTHASCLGAQDPFCGWDERREICVSVPNGPKGHWNQNMPACPDTSIPLNGGWSAWSRWERCLQKKDYSENTPDDAQDKCICQTRVCNNPKPRNGGKQCEGISISVTNCTVHGGWTAWSGWSACSASCGVAVKWRRRSCGAPAPQHGGRLCVGPDRSEIYCTQNPPCPAPVQPVEEGGWSDWSPWSTCSLPCGGGVRWKQRRCDSPPPPPGSPTCPGCATEAEICNPQPCETRRTSAWTPWQYAKLNNISEGTLVEKRFKLTCSAKSSEQIKLAMAKEEIRYCNVNGTCGSAPIFDSLDNAWSEWSSWDKCNVECGGGFQTSKRTCLKPPCQGNLSNQRVCNMHSCSDGWSCWSDWSPCTVSCGKGRTERRRTCLLPMGCKGDAVQTTFCEGPTCESLLGWSEWSSWTKCDINNKQHRTRRCLAKQSIVDSDICQGPDTETKLCNIEEKINESQQYSSHMKTEGKKEEENMGFSTGTLVGMMLIALLIGIILAIGPIIWFVRNRTNQIPSSPHYITKQNSYVSVPLKEVPKKRIPSFSGIRSTTSGITLSKTNNINTDTDGILDSPKLYPKAMAGDYETATVKRNSHSMHNNNSCRNNIDVEQDRFY